MPRPHPPELRQRVLDAYARHLDTYKEIAERFCVGEASVSRWVSQLRRTGSLAPKPAGGKRPRGLTPDAVALVLSLVRDEPNWTTAELANEVAEALGIRVSREVIGQTLRREGITFKRGSSDRQQPSLRGWFGSERRSARSRSRWTRAASYSWMNLG